MIILIIVLDFLSTISSIVVVVIVVVDTECTLKPDNFSHLNPSSFAVWSNSPSYGGVKYGREVRNSYDLLEVTGYSLICITLSFNSNRANFVVNIASFSEQILS